MVIKKKHDFSVLHLLIYLLCNALCSLLTFCVIVSVNDNLKERVETYLFAFFPT